MRFCPLEFKAEPATLRQKSTRPDIVVRRPDAREETIVDHTLETAYRVFPEMRRTVDFTHVHRWHKALPFTRIGAYRDIGRFNAGLDPNSPVQYAADFMSAAGQNTAVESDPARPAT